MEEKWKSITGYKSLYQISNLGNVRSISGLNGKYVSKPLAVRQDKYGYLLVDLHKHGNRKTLRVHRLVAREFVSGYHQDYEVNHINGIKNDNRAANLEWNTKSQNQKHAFDTKLNVPKSGEEHLNSKLSLRDVRKIREYYHSGRYSQKKLSQLFGVTQNNIHKIVNNITWVEDLKNV